MEKPYISVIIPALNEERFLPYLLSSLATQSRRDFEVIVVDGQSKDKTIAVAKTYAKLLPKLKIIVSDHANLPYQRNLGAKEAKGTWLVFLDADNVMMPYAIERAEQFIHSHKPSFFTCWTRPDSDVINDAIVALFGNIVIEGSILAKRPFSPGPFTAVSMSVFQKVGGYTDGLAWGEDVDFSNKVRKVGLELSILREVLYIWSMRRLRKEGKLKFIQQAARASFHVLLTNRALTTGYEMGGQLYKKKRIKASALKKLSEDIKKLMKEVFE